MEVITIVTTRGLIFADTLKSLQDNEVSSPLIISGLQIPESHNEGVRQALKEYSTYIFFVEDDMRFPALTLKQMIKVDASIVCVDYPMDNGSSTIAKKGEEILWCGLGCTLIKRGVLANMADPWFDTSYSYKINEDHSLTKIVNPNKYGGHDINFCFKARELGYEIKQLPGIEAEHLRCSELVKGKYNTGVQFIKPLEKITKYQNY